MLLDVLYNIINLAWCQKHNFVLIKVKHPGNNECHLLIRFEAISQEIDKSFIDFLKVFHCLTVDKIAFRLIILFLAVIIIVLRKLIYLFYLLIALLNIWFFLISVIFVGFELIRGNIWLLTFSWVNNDRSLNKLSLDLIYLKYIVFNHEICELLMISVIDCDSNNTFHKLEESLKLYFIQWTDFIFILLRLFYLCSLLNLLRLYLGFRL